MKNVFLLILSLTCTISYSQVTKDTEPTIPLTDVVAVVEPKTRSAAKVYVCDSKTAKAYHSSHHCRGLNRCTHGVVAITKQEAEDNYGRVPCQICY